MGYRCFFGWLGGTPGTMFARERGIIPIAVKSCGNFPAVLFARTALRTTTILFETHPTRQFFTFKQKSEQHLRPLSLSFQSTEDSLHKYDFIRILIGILEWIYCYFAQRAMNDFVSSLFICNFICKSAFLFIFVLSLTKATSRVVQASFRLSRVFILKKPS